MKVSCLQENLSKGLSTVSRAVSTRTTLPITNNVLIATDEGRLKLSATNLEIAITAWIGAKVEEEGAITVPARLLSEFVGSLPPEKVDMELQENKRLQIDCARQQARLSGQDADDFPPIPRVGQGVTVELNADDLRAAIQRVAFSAATDESRPVLTGVHTSIAGDTLTMAAADGFRLAVNKLALSTPVEEKIEAIIPARSYRELDRLLADHEGAVTVTFNTQRSQVLFQMKNVEMVSQLIQGTFPNYKQLIPERYDTRAVVEAGEFLRVTKTAAIFARDGNGIVRLYLEPSQNEAAGQVKLEARSEEVGENTGKIDAQVDGQAAKIAFNSRYLTDVLNILGKGKVALEISNPSSPGVIRSTESDSYTHVVMPMFVQWS